MDTSLLSLSPLDGRYENKISSLKTYFSEYAFMKYRVKVELYYLNELLSYLKIINDDDINKLNDIIKNIIDKFNLEELKKIKEHEKQTKHDVKAVEYYILDKLNELTKNDLFSKINTYVHFGLTSQDINCTSNTLMLRDSITNIIYPKLELLLQKTLDIYNEYKEIPMLSHTHGQPASPTTFGKEIGVYYSRLNNSLKKLKNYEYITKFGGAIGNMNAHYIAYPDKNWVSFANYFMEEILLIKRHNITTQVSHYDEISELLDLVKRINTVLIDMSVDMWLYISKGYLNQKIKKGEVGSSTMPHKVNPINFENAEGNLILSSGLCESISRKLPISRLQRDLTDSTILRNLGVIFGYALVAYESLFEGLNKIEVNKELLIKDLEKNNIILAEAIQTILRREGIKGSYELLKDFTHGKRENLTIKDIHNFIDNLKTKLNLSDNLVIELKSLKVEKYIGVV